MHFIAHNAVPPGRKATYSRIVASIRPQKAEPKRIRFTIGANLVQYPGKVSTPTSHIVQPMYVRRIVTLFDSAW